MLPEGAPERLNDRATLWNEVEAGEKRKDAQLAREVEFSIPRELNQAQGVELARDFVEKQFVERGMVADLNVHWDMGKDGQPKPHAHVMLSMREVGPEGFGQKVREWNSAELLQGGARRGPIMSTSGLPSWILMRGSIIAPWRRRGSSLSRSTRSGRRHRVCPNRGLRPSGSRTMPGSRARMARRSSPAGNRAGRDHAATGDVHAPRPGACSSFRHSDGKDQFDSR
jgi:hypothetical protein